MWTTPLLPTRGGGSIQVRSYLEGGGWGVGANVRHLSPDIWSKTCSCSDAVFELETTGGLPYEPFEVRDPCVT